MKLATVRRVANDLGVREGPMLHARKMHQLHPSQQASSEIAAGASKIETPTLGWFTILLVLHRLAHQSGAVVEERVMSINQS